MLKFSTIVLALLPVASAFLSGPALFQPGLRPTADRNAALTICMGRKPATVGKGATTTREKIREKKQRDPSVPVEIKVKRVTGVDMSKAMILSKLDKATKDNFAAEVLNDKVVTFLTKEAGSTMYPKLMKEIKFKASRLGVKVPDRFAYEAKANAKSRALLAKKIAAKAEAAAAPEAATK